MDDFAIDVGFNDAAPIGRCRQSGAGRHQQRQDGDGFSKFYHEGSP